ncbi:SPOR domain-containing protein [Janthinobacterium sp. B9-8]|uniref:SPOR domain-containing protein n=1 Tax=Janthinobacterium sp. B9-8 TaxID=1236179 RepID=UPI00061D1F86|nr:SPOR domain-containing protein [Janthinobacterium sp. B9-8]AMC34327.1 hypothetical protein VN23_06800 [Janthinobacterium sp. B9-8]
MLNRNVSEDLLQLKKRARRRLVGAIALVLFALIVLWTALDSEPPATIAGANAIEIISSSPALQQPPTSEPVLAALPGQVASAPAEAALLTPVPDPVVLPATPVPTAVPAYRAASTAQNVLPGKLVNHQKKVVVATPAPTTPPTPKAKPAVDPLRILEGLDGAPAAKQTASADKRYFIQVGAYADAEKAAQVVSKLQGTGIPAYSEKTATDKGSLTRVRVGPVSDEAKAQSYLKKMGVLGFSGHLSSK